jgi:hypothetical protein
VPEQHKGLVFSFVRLYIVCGRIYVLLKIARGPVEREVVARVVKNKDFFDMLVFVLAQEGIIQGKASSVRKAEKFQAETPVGEVAEFSNKRKDNKNTAQIYKFFVIFYKLVLSWDKLLFMDKFVGDL